MENFNKLPDSKDKHQQSNQETDLTEHEKRQEELNKRLSSIFPYFKQVMSSDNRSKSNLYRKIFLQLINKKGFSIRTESYQ